MKRNRKRKTKKARGKSHYYSTYVWNTQEKICFLLKMAQTRPFYLLLFFSHDKYSANTINDKSVDGVLGIRTRGGRMVGQTNLLSYGGTPRWIRKYWFVAIIVLRSSWILLVTQCLNSDMLNLTLQCATHFSKFLCYPKGSFYNPGLLRPLFHLFPSVK